MTSRRRRTVWNDQFVNSEFASGLTGSTLSLVTGLSSDEMSGWTLTRLILGLTLIPAVPSAVTGTQLLSLGVGVFDTEGFLAGTVPDPDNDADHPSTGWLYRDAYVVEDDTGPGRGRLGIRIEKDLRAQRRFRLNSYGLVVSNGALTGTAFSVDITGFVRSLYLLP